MARHINAIEENHQMDDYRAILDKIQQAAHFYKQAHEKMPPSEWPPEVMISKITFKLTALGIGAHLNVLLLSINSTAWNSQNPQPMEIETNKRFQTAQPPPTLVPPYSAATAAQRVQYDRSKSP